MDESSVKPNRVYTANYNWRNSAPPPASGQVETDTQTWTTATHISLANITADGKNLAQVLGEIPVNSTLSIQQTNTPANTATWTVTGAPVNNSTYWTFPVSLVSSGGVLPNNNAACTLSYTSIFSAMDAFSRVYISPDEAGVFLMQLSRLFPGDTTMITIRNSFLDAAYEEWGYPDPYP